MKNIYLRNNVFYYRKTIPNHLKIFLQNKKIFSGFHGFLQNY